jgi:alpha-galactosidase
MTRVVCLGAGSSSFGQSTLITLLRSEVLNGAELALVDTNPDSLAIITDFANWLNSAWNCQKTITSHISHKTALKGADFVISAVEVQPREQLWQEDFERTLPLGIRQPYAENGGPGGFAHAARNVNTLLGIVHDMEEQCPDAWFINFTNPMHRICYLIHKYSKIKVVGLCHQLAAGYAMVAKALAPQYQLSGAEDFLSTHADPRNDKPMANMASQGIERFAIKAAGLNHFTWLLELRGRKTGEDLYPRFRQSWHELPESFEPLTRRIFDAFDLFPIPGDEHLCEYLPWMSDAVEKPWQKFDISLYDWDYFAKHRDLMWQQLKQDIVAGAPSETYTCTHSEGAIEVIEAILTDANLFWEAVNIPNAGLIEGLPEDAIVEVPALINRSGIHGQQIGSLPKGITALLQREVITSQLCIDSVVKGDRTLALQSLLLDPTITDLDQAEDVLEQILTSSSRFLPQFFS